MKFTLRHCERVNVSSLVLWWKRVAQSVENLILGAGHCPLPLSANDVPAMKGHSP